MEDDGAEGGRPPHAWSGWGFPRWAIFFMVPGVAAPLLILVFILRTDLAHDEQSCPFTPVTTQRLDAGVSVREDMRTCLEGVQERRFVMLRGNSQKVLGRRRFDPEAFADGYSWRAELTEAGEVRVHVTNPGHPQQSFREGNAEDHAAWNSR